MFKMKCLLFFVATMAVSPLSFSQHKDFHSNINLQGAVYNVEENMVSGNHLSLKNSYCHKSDQLLSSNFYNLGEQFDFEDCFKHKNGSSAIHSNFLFCNCVAKKSVTNPTLKLSKKELEQWEDSYKNFAFLEELFLKAQTLSDSQHRYLQDPIAVAALKINPEFEGKELNDGLGCFSMDAIYNNLKKESKESCYDRFRSLGSGKTDSDKHDENEEKIAKNTAFLFLESFRGEELPEGVLLDHEIEKARKRFNDADIKIKEELKMVSELHKAYKKDKENKDNKWAEKEITAKEEEFLKIFSEDVKFSYFFYKIGHDFQSPKEKLVAFIKAIDERIGGEELSEDPNVLLKLAFKNTFGDIIHESIEDCKKLNEKIINACAQLDKSSKLKMTRAVGRSFLDDILNMDQPLSFSRYPLNLFQFKKASMSCYVTYYRDGENCDKDHSKLFFDGSFGDLNDTLIGGCEPDSRYEPVRKKDDFLALLKKRKMKKGFHLSTSNFGKYTGLVSMKTSEKGDIIKNKEYGKIYTKINSSYSKRIEEKQNANSGLNGSHKLAEGSEGSEISSTQAGDEVTANLSSPPTIHHDVGEGDGNKMEGEIGETTTNSAFTPTKHETSLQNVAPVLGDVDDNTENPGRGISDENNTENLLAQGSAAIKKTPSTDRAGGHDISDVVPGNLKAVGNEDALTKTVEKRWKNRPPVVGSRSYIPRLPIIENEKPKAITEIPHSRSLVNSLISNQLVEGPMTKLQDDGMIFFTEKEIKDGKVSELDWNDDNEIIKRLEILQGEPIFRIFEDGRVFKYEMSNGSIIITEGFMKGSPEYFAYLSSQTGGRAPASITDPIGESNETIKHVPELSKITDMLRSEAEPR